MITKYGLFVFGFPGKYSPWVEEMKNIHVTTKAEKLLEATNNELTELHAKYETTSQRTDISDSEREKQLLDLIDSARKTKSRATNSDAAPPVSTTLANKLGPEKTVKVLPGL